MQTFKQQRRERPGPAAGGDARRVDAAEHAPALHDRQPASVAQLALQETLSQSPRVQTQLQLGQALNESPRAVAQAKLASALAERPATPAPEAVAQRQTTEDEEEVAQRQTSEDEEMLATQARCSSAAGCEAEGEDGEDDGEEKISAPGVVAPVQGKSGDAPATAVAGGGTKGGLPAGLRAGVEALSGVSLADVKVEYNSAEPARIGALATTQGREIKLGAGQERHLPHEAWHAAQQKQGRVRATTQLRRTPVNDDQSLEREADVMGAKALQAKTANETLRGDESKAAQAGGPAPVVQAIRSVATFRGQTPGTFGSPRRTVTTIDTALGNYINSVPGNRLATLNALILAINTYTGTPGRDPGRVAVANALLQEAQDERALYNAIGAPNEAMFDDLVTRAGGLGNIAALTAVANTLGVANIALLPNLITVSGGGANLAALQGAIAAILPANAYILQGLIPAAGGGGNLVALQGVINAILPANAFMLPGLVQAAGGGANLLALQNLITAILPANAHLLQNLIPAAGGGANLAALQTVVTTILPANAYLLSGLIPLAGGAANLAALNQVINTIQPANVLQLFQFIPLAGGAGQLATLDALIQAMGLAHLNLVPDMVANAGGVNAIPDLTNVINHAHAGQGNLALALTQRAAGNLARFQQLAGIVPNFAQAPVPGGVPANVTAEVAAYNLAAPGGHGLQLNRRIGQVNFAHFLQRHTQHYFDFGQIGPVNDQWPFVGAGADAQVAAVLVAALQNIHGNAVPNWWIQPNAAQVVVAGGFTSSVGVTAVGAPPLPNPNPPYNNIPSVILGQFFPHPGGGGGVINLDRDDMNAIRQLL